MQISLLTKARIILRSVFYHTSYTDRKGNQVMDNLANLAWQVQNSVTSDHNHIPRDLEVR